MVDQFTDWFRKEESESSEVATSRDTVFILKVDSIELAKLSCSNGFWEFEYTESFKKLYSKEYNLIAGFPDLNKKYRKKSLWPFFLTRIPGLKQPAVKEIIEKEKIDVGDQVELLKRFGHRSISNPYQLVAS